MRNMPRFRVDRIEGLVTLRELPPTVMHLTDAKDGKDG